MRTVPFGTNHGFFENRESRGLPRPEAEYLGQGRLPEFGGDGEKRALSHTIILEA